jgi:hypothetical protein
MPLTDEEYEDVYREALRCLSGDGRTVGVPFRTEAGARHCDVDGRKLDDRGVFEAWWGDQVTQGRTTLNPNVPLKRGGSYCLAGV